MTPKPPTTTAADPHQTALASLIRVLGWADQIRLRLQREGGTSSDLILYARALERKVSFPVPGRTIKCPLHGPDGLEAQLRAANSDFSFSVIRLPNRLPAFYLCRTHADYWARERLITEEYYLSPGFPLTDRRFVRLMKPDGREAFFLRLAPLRPRVMAKYLQDFPAPEAAARTDQLLHQLWKSVFRSAWHEDQRLAVTAADALGLPRFKDAIELLYLLLGGDYCELRDAADPIAMSFFRHVYPQPAIHALLTAIGGMNEADFNQLSQKAVDAYRSLEQAFRAFLDAAIEGWGPARVATRLDKIIYGNFNRLGEAAERLKQNEAFTQASRELEMVSAGLGSAFEIKI